MSTLYVANYSNQEQDKVVPSAYILDGSAKGWINFNGTGTISTRDSFNVSSLTDNATGDYSVNFTNSFGNNDYTLSASARGNDVVIGHAEITNSVSAARVYSVLLDGTSGLTDTETVSPVIHGDLA